MEERPRGRGRPVVAGNRQRFATGLDAQLSRRLRGGEVQHAVSYGEVEIAHRVVRGDADESVTQCERVARIDEIQRNQPVALRPDMQDPGACLILPYAASPAVGQHRLTTARR